MVGLLGLEARSYDGTASRSVTATKRKTFGEFIFLLSGGVSTDGLIEGARP